MQRGFTLIELMIVIAIISILAALAIPAYQDYIARAQVTEAINISSQYKVSISHIYSQTGECPTFSDVGLSIPSDGATKYMESVDLINQSGAICAVQFTFKNTGIARGLRNTHLVIALINQTADLGSANWTCTSNDISQKYLPKTCSGI